MARLVDDLLGVFRAHGLPEDVLVLSASITPNQATLLVTDADAEADEVTGRLLVRELRFSMGAES